MSVRFGLLGSGAMAASMTPAFAHAKGAHIAGVASRSLLRAQAFAAAHNISAAFGAYDEMLRDQSIDAVYIANLTGDHARASIAALEAGKHVLCEKPFAMNAAQGEAVIAAARASGKLFMEGLWTHFLPAYIRAYGAVNGDEAGAPMLLSAAYGYPSSPDISPRLFAKDDGGVLLDLGGYCLSLALKLMGPVASMHADVLRNGDGVDTHLTVSLRHANGGVSQLAASLDALVSNSAVIACRQGSVTIRAPLFGAERIRVDHYAPQAPVSDDGLKATLKTALKQNPLMRRVKAARMGGEHHPYGASQYLPQLDHFVGLLAAGKTESDVVSHAFSLDVARLIDRIRDSEKAG